MMNNVDKDHLLILASLTWLKTANVVRKSEDEEIYRISTNHIRRWALCTNALAFTSTINKLSDAYRKDKIASRNVKRKEEERRETEREREREKQEYIEFDIHRFSLWLVNLLNRMTNQSINEQLIYLSIFASSSSSASNPSKSQCMHVSVKKLSSHLTWFLPLHPLPSNSVMCE